jgi:hypothetical protein
MLVSAQSRTIAPSSSSATFDHELSNSLHFIKVIKRELAEISHGHAPADLACRVKLCNMLLSEIRVVRRRIAGELNTQPLRASAARRSEESSTLDQGQAGADVLFAGEG